MSNNRKNTSKKPGTNDAKKDGDNNTPTENENKKLDLETEIAKVEQEIIAESIKITKNEVSSCYTLVVKTKRLLELRLMK